MDDEQAARFLAAHAEVTPADGCVFVIDVGFTWHRPVRPDERTHRIVLAWPDDDPVAASLYAAQWIACRYGVVMPTRSEIVAAAL